MIAVYMSTFTGLIEKGVHFFWKNPSTSTYPEVGEVVEVIEFGEVDEVNDFVEVGEVVEEGEVEEVGEVVEASDVDEVVDVSELGEAIGVEEVSGVGEVGEVGGVSEVDEVGEVGQWSWWVPVQSQTVLIEMWQYCTKSDDLYCTKSDSNMDYTVQSQTIIVYNIGTQSLL